MKSKVSGNRVVELSGLRDQKIIVLPVICIRKNVLRSGFSHSETRKAKRFLRKHKVLAIVSHPTVARSRTSAYVDAWCHPFRDPNLFIPKHKPSLLLSESDFIDPRIINISPVNKIKWDFFCFVMGGRKQRNRKGVGLLINSLPVLCDKFKLRGVIINYSMKGLTLLRDEKRIFRSCRRIKYIKKKFTPRKVALLMSQCRFGFFPNWQDCSPLLLAESIVRNRPVMVNKDIYGGWKYINKNTGVLFNDKNLEKKCLEVLDSKYCPRDDFLTNYGFDNSSKRLADWGRQNFKSFKGVKKVCFSGLARFLR